MKEREPLIVGGMVLLLFLLWLGFPLHQSPRFAGSLLGGVFAVTGSILMLIPLAYLFVKRIPRLKRLITQRVKMRTLLAWHIYAGVFGPILVIIHTGHKFESPIGILLTAMVLIVVLSGFVGRYLMSKINKEIKSKRSMLEEARRGYEDAVTEISGNPDESSLVEVLRVPLVRLFFAPERLDAMPMSASVRAVGLAESVADLEYAIRSHEFFKRTFATWLKIHISLSIFLYILLGFHVWSAVYFGLRWFS
jgi:hypothetical protein